MPIREIATRSTVAGLRPRRVVARLYAHLDFPQRLLEANRVRPSSASRRRGRIILNASAGGILCPPTSGLVRLTATRGRAYTATLGTISMLPQGNVFELFLVVSDPHIALRRHA